MSENETAAHPAPRPRWPLQALMVLAVAGIVDAAVLTHTHAQILSTPDFESFCNISQTVSCDDALTSGYSKLLGVPVSIFAVVAYALLFALALVDLRALGADPQGRRAEDKAVPAAHRLFFLAAWNALFSLYMALVSTVALGVVCPLCAGLYAIALLALILAWKNLPRGVGHAFAGLGEELGGLANGSPKNWLVEGSAALAIAGLVVLFNTADPMAPKSAAAGTPVAAKTASEPKAESPDAQHEQLKEKMRQWLASLPTVDADKGSHPPKGDAAAAVQIVEFADFQCPACKRAWESLNKAIKENPGRIAVNFRHFPLSNTCNAALTSNIHPHACDAAKAAVCADRQDAFWKMADQMFIYQPRLSRENLSKWAGELELDTGAFEKCMSDPKTMETVKRDIEEGLRIQVNSTPTLIINSRRVRGLPESDVLKLLIEVETEKQ